MMELLSLFLFPIIAALCLALIAGPIGCFVTWRRMAFYSDTLSHAALLGIALGLMAGVGAVWGVLFVGCASTLALLFLQNKSHLAPDTLLAMIAQASLAAGILLIYTHPELQVNLYGFLFGDVLAISQTDALMIIIAAVIVIAALLQYWRPLMLVTIHEELAQAEGIPVGRMHALLLTLMALTVAIGIYVAGVMMVTSLLVIPAATARRITHTPNMMAAAASIIGVGGVLSGLAVSFVVDVPPGPTIVLALTGFFIFAFAFSKRQA